jgi:hypothetical protein
MPRNAANSIMDFGVPSSVSLIRSSRFLYRNTRAFATSMYPPDRYLKHFPNHCCILVLFERPEQLVTLVLTGHLMGSLVQNRSPGNQLCLCSLWNPAVRQKWTDSDNNHEILIWGKGKEADCLTDDADCFAPVANAAALPDVDRGQRYHARHYFRSRMRWLIIVINTAVVLVIVIAAIAIPCYMRQKTEPRFSVVPLNSSVLILAPPQPMSSPLPRRPSP